MKRIILKESELVNLIKRVINEQASPNCDNTMQGFCAVNYLPPNINFPNMTNHDCTGSNKYDSTGNRFGQQMMAILQQYPDATSNAQAAGAPNWGAWSNTSSWVNASGIPQPDKGKLKRKIAKHIWAFCMHNACGC